MTTQVPPDLLQTPFRKNMIINPAMDIWQRGTVEAVADSVLSRLCDRFVYYNDRDTGAATFQRSTDIPSAAECGVYLNYSMEVDITTAHATLTTTNEASISYTLEGYDYAKLAGNNATLSFWVKSNKTGTYAVAFRNSAKNRCYTVEYTIDVADTWEKKTVTVPLTETGGTWDYTNGIGLNINWAQMSNVGYASTSTFNTWNSSNTPYTDNQVNLFDNTANYFRMTCVQFEQGTLATDFERRHIAEELALCQRYYCTGKEQEFTNELIGTNTIQLAGTPRYPVTMRSDPVWTVKDNAGTAGRISKYSTTSATVVNGLTYNAIGNGVWGRAIRTAANTGNYYGYIYTWFADAEI